MKNKTFLIAVALLFLAVGCDNTPKPESDPTSNPAKSALLSDYDMVLMEAGQLVFYDNASGERLTFAAETDSVVNAVYASNNILFYSVGIEGNMVLKSLNLNETDPKPVKLADWNVKVEECHGIYPYVENLIMNEDETAVGLFNESVRFIAYSKLARYDIKTGEVKNEVMVEFNEETGEETYHAIDFAAKLPQPIKSEQFESDGHGMLYYLDGSNGKTCLSDSLDYLYMFDAVPEDLVDEEIISEPVSFNPAKTKLLFISLVPWGDFGTGSYCVADLDGSHQKDLETDAFFKYPEWLKDGSLVYFHLAEGLFDIPLPEDYHTMIMTPDGNIKELSKSPNFTVKPL